MKDDYTANTQRAYEDAERYEKATALLVPTPEINRLASYLPEKANVLDAGSAFGRDTRYLADMGFKLTGLDMSENLILRAKQLHPDLNFLIGDVRNMKLKNNSFDGIWCHATLLHLTDEDILAALSEFKRVLTDDGVIAVSFKKGEGTSNFVEQFSSDGERFFNFQTKESFQKLLEKAGFKQLESHYANERERFGKDNRDLDWLYTYARPVSQQT